MGMPLAYLASPNSLGVALGAEALNTNVRVAGSEAQAFSRSSAKLAALNKYYAYSCFPHSSQSGKHAV
eukprot:353037-Chlamydomonas_euryale.AAC.8